MAGAGDAEDRPLPPSLTRLRDLRRDGKVPRSRDFPAAVALVAGLAWLALSLRGIGARLEAAFLAVVLAGRPFAETATALALDLSVIAAGVILPVFAVMAVAHVAASVAETRGVVASFAAVSFASNFLFPSVRWFFRARAERAVARLNQRLDRPIDLFKLAERQDRIARLIYDSAVMEAVADYAAETGQPVPVVFEQARRFAREIVPGFSATLYFGVAIRLARGLSRSLYRVRFGKPDDALRGIDPQAALVFVINHRSNMDYVLVTWLVARRASYPQALMKPYRKGER
jgi:hypothetical protein